MIVCLLAGPALQEVRADFSGAFAPSNFTLANNNANGSVNTTGAPASISITGGDNQSNTSGYTLYSLAAPAAGRVAFRWSFSSADRDGPQYDPFGYVQNGTFVQLSNNSGGTGVTQTGNSAFAIGAGQVMGFRVNTNDNILGASTGTVSNFLFSDTTYWKGNTNSTWTASNWTLDAAGTVATSAPNTTMNVAFSASGAGSINTTLGADANIKSLTVSDPGAVTIAGTNTLTVSGAAGTTGIHVNSGAGAVTISSNVNLAGASQNIAVNNEAGLAINGRISGSSGLVKEGTGPLTLGGIIANTYTGTTTLNGGTLALNKSAATDAIAGGTIILNSGGTLLLQQRDQINDSTGLTLNGGTFSTGAGFSETLGTLTLTSDSTISLANSIHLLTFGDSSMMSWSATAKLTITGWSGSAGLSGDMGRIYFGNNYSSLTDMQLANITFANYGPGAQLLSSGELVPTAVPETETYLAGLLVASLVAWRERNRFAFVACRLRHDTSLPTVHA